jgi:hypothetical protein
MSKRTPASLNVLGNPFAGSSKALLNGLAASGFLGVSLISNGRTNLFDVQSRPPPTLACRSPVR